MTRPPVVAGPIGSRAIEDIRGTNYFPSTTLSHNNSLGLLPLHGNYPLPYLDGFFVDSHTAEELSNLASHGINNIRLLGSFYGWLTNPVGYEQSLRVLCRLCRQYGITITYIIWSAINAAGVNCVVPGGGLADNPYLHFQNARFPFPGSGVNPRLMKFHWDLSVTWHLGAAPSRGILIPSNDAMVTFYAEPGDGQLWRLGRFGNWPQAFQTLVRMYVQWLAKFFRYDPHATHTLFSYDLFNEPDQYFGTYTRIPFYDLIKLTYREVLAIHPTALTTVGFAGYDSSFNADLRNSYGVYQSYHSFHYYPHSTGPVSQDIKGIRSKNSRFGVPLVCSEFWFSLLRGQLSKFLDALAAYDVSGQVWGFLQSNWYVPSNTVPVDIDGVLQPPPASSVFKNSRLGLFAPLNQADQRAVRAWATTSGSRRWT